MQEQTREMLRQALVDRVLPMYIASFLYESVPDAALFVALDGGAATGKGTQLAEFGDWFGTLGISAGAYYRSTTAALLAYEAENKVRIALTQEEVGNLSERKQRQNAIDLHAFLEHLQVRRQENWGGIFKEVVIEHHLLREQRMVLTDAALRSDEINARVSAVAGHPIIRAKVDEILVEDVRYLREMDSPVPLVVEGRDNYQRLQGIALMTLLFLTVSNEQVLRQRLELRERGRLRSEGVLSPDPEELAKRVDAEVARTQADEAREGGRLLSTQKAAESGLYSGIIDTSFLTPEQVACLIMAHVVEAQRQPEWATPLIAQLTHVFETAASEMAELIRLSELLSAIPQETPWQRHIAPQIQTRIAEIRGTQPSLLEMAAESLLSGTIS